MAIWHSRKERARRRKWKLRKKKARLAAREGRIHARKSAKITRQKERTKRRTARIAGRTKRTKARTGVRESRIEAKQESGYYTPEAIQARMAGLAGTVAAVGHAAAEFQHGPAEETTVVTGEGMPGWVLPVAAAAGLGLILVMAGNKKGR